MRLFRGSMSMSKAHFMDEHPIRTSASMSKAHFMDKHRIRSSVSMRKAHFMDKHPTRSSVPLFASGLEALGLLGDQFVEDALVEIVDPHSALH